MINRKQVRNDLLGSKFGHEDSLEIVGFSRNKNSSSSHCLVRCSICAADYELHGDGIFKVEKKDLLAGSIPCGCNKSHHYSKNQLTLLLERFCIANDKIFLGYVGEFIGKKSKISVACKVCDKHYNVSIAGRFLNSVGSCPDCNLVALANYTKQADDVIIGRFIATGKFAKGTIFCRSLRDAPLYWDFKCPVCSKDEYTLNGLCSGVFTAAYTSLKAGHISCRCAASTKLSKAQKEFKIKTIIEDENLNYKFLNWKSDRKYENRFTISCKEHGEWEGTATTFINLNISRCPICSNSGFDKTKPSQIYILKVTGRRDFTGYGISGKLSERLKTHKRNLMKFGCCIDDYEVFHCSGKQAIEVESAVKREFKCFSQQIEGFIREATLPENYLDVIEFVENYLTTSEKENIIEITK